MPKFVEILDLRGGRNGADPPISLPENQAVEMLNVDHYDGMLGRKRGGSEATTESGGTAFATGIQSIFRHVPGSDAQAAEFWGLDGAATPHLKRMAGGSTYADVTLTDNFTAASTPYAVAVSLNGKLFIAYDSAVDRLHCYDPLLAAPRVRVVGFATPSPLQPADVANQGGGAYPATLRYYRLRGAQISGSRYIRRSEASTSQSITPSGAGLSIRITPSTMPGEQATHWEVEVSTDDTTWYVLAGPGAPTSSIAVGTTFIDDTTLTSAYTTLPSAEQAGLYTAPTSVKYLLTDGNRLIMAGSWESGGKTSRIWFTPVLGSLDRGDDERLPNTSTQKNFVDLNENDGGSITALGGPIQGAVFAFKYRNGVYKLTPTGDVSAPYLPRKIADNVGCIAHKGCVVARDEVGNPALYFPAVEGPYRLVVVGGVTQLQYLGRDVEDIWSGVNLAATSVLCHSVYHQTLHQVWMWIATGSSNDPDVKLVFDVLLGRVVGADRVRGGWYKHTGSQAAARCSTMMSNTLGATMSSDLKPYIGRSTGTVIWKCDTTALDDAGTAYQAYIKTRPIKIAPLGQNVGVGQTFLLAKEGSATITQTLDRDYGAETRTSTVTTVAETGTQTRVLKKFEGSDLAAAGTVQIQIGDASALAKTWSLDGLMVPIIGQEIR
jgi:hypothetical protein